jgi:hypothetical protein
MIQRFQAVAKRWIAPADLTIKFRERMSYGCEKPDKVGLSASSSSNASFG